MTSLTKKPQPQAKNIFSSRRLAVSFETFTRSVEHTGPEIPMQSHVHLGVFFLKIPGSGQTPKSYFQKFILFLGILYLMFNSFVFSDLGNE